MSTNTQQRASTLVLGGTGKTGRRVAARLRALDLPVRIGSRAGEPPFDWDDASTWAPVLDNVGAVYVSFAPDLALPGAAERIAAFAEVAVAHGARRLVLLSGRGEEAAVASERALQQSGAAWTILRCSLFCQNFSEDFLLDAVLGGVVALPAADVAEPFIDADDIADVAVAALTSPRHIGQLYELTGPRLLTFADASAEIAAATGRNLRYMAISPADFMTSLAEQGFPPDDAAGLTELFTRVLDGRNAYLADGVERALGREPRDFATYARNAAATGVWAATAEAVAR